MPKYKQPPKSPLQGVPPETALINSVLSLAMNSEVAPDVSTLSNGLFQGLTGRPPEPPKNGRRSIWLAAYTTGSILREFLPEAEEEEPCPTTKPITVRSYAARKSLPPKRG